MKRSPVPGMPIEMYFPPYGPMPTLRNESPMLHPTPRLETVLRSGPNRYVFRQNHVILSRRSTAHASYSIRFSESLVREVLYTCSRRKNIPPRSSDQPGCQS
jgi:hypothetical protein